MSAPSPLKKSTNDRKIDAWNRPPPSAPWYLRAGLGTLGVVAPPLAVAWAERLWLTPPRHAPPPDEAAAIEAARAWSVEVDGRRVAAWTWGHGPTVVLVHGWGGRGGQLHPFVRPLLTRGLSVVAFDGPGHGRSDGRTSSVVEHGRAVAAVIEAIPGEVAGVVAHSMGGAATAYALRLGARVPRAVFVATPRSPVGWSRGFSRALALGAEVEEGMRARVERRLGVAFADLEVGAAGEGRDTALLVVHDREDREVPWEDGAAIVAAWPGARLVTTRGLGHRRILADEDVVAGAAAFVGEGAR